MKKVLISLAAMFFSGLYANAQTDTFTTKQSSHFYVNAEMDTSTIIQSPEFYLAAQSDTFTTIQFPNFYTNTITTGLYSANNRSGFIYQSNASMNYGLIGAKAVGFKFRWLAHDNGSIDYTTDTDQLMTLDNNGNLNMKGTLTTGGNIGIGTTTTGTNKLAVEGTIAARRVKVTQSGTWPDFVFEPEYKLPSLSELEIYIRSNKHLPEVPSAAEVAKDGLDVGEMNKILLQKIEELTLHVIELQKQINCLKEKNRK